MIPENMPCRFLSIIQHQTLAFLGALESGDWSADDILQVVIETLRSQFRRPRIPCRVTQDFRGLIQPAQKDPDNNLRLINAQYRVFRPAITREVSRDSGGRSPFGTPEVFCCVSRE